MKIADLPLDQIIPYPNNPRHNEGAVATLDAAREAIRAVWDADVARGHDPLEHMNVPNCKRPGLTVSLK